MKPRRRESMILELFNNGCIVVWGARKWKMREGTIVLSSREASYLRQRQRRRNRDDVVGDLPKGLSGSRTSL